MVRRIQTEGAYYVVSDNSSMDELELRELAAAIKSRPKLTQPNFIIDMRYDYEFIQLRALWLITELLQPVIKNNIANKASVLLETNNVYINQEHNEVEVFLPMQSFGLQRHRYEDMRRALTNIAKISVSYPKESYKIRKTVHGEGVLCTYVGFSRDETNLRREMVHFFFPLDIATCLVSPEIGFTNLLQQTLETSKSIYTCKIYMYICRAADRGKWNVSYEKLREILCIGDKFQRYYDFRNRILRESENELRGNSNYWFDLVECFPKRGAATPSFLIFNIHSASNSTQDIQLFHRYKTKISETMCETLKIKDRVARTLLQQVTPRNIKYLWRKHNEIIAYMASISGSIDDVKAYYMGSMKKVIDTEKFSYPIQPQLPF